MILPFMILLILNYKYLLMKSLKKNLYIIYNKMMNYYSNMSGPTKSKAISQKKNSTRFPNNIKAQYNIQNQKVLNKILSDTIIYSVNQVYKGQNECPGSLTGYGVFVSKEIDKKIRETLPLHIKQYINNKTISAKQRLAFATGLKRTSNNPMNTLPINLVESIGTHHLTHGADPHLEILKKREAKINEMIQNEETDEQILKKITNLKIYYDNKLPGRYNIQTALNKFKKSGYNITKGGKSKKYIQLQSGGKRLVHIGKRGGKYYMKGGNKIYI